MDFGKNKEVTVYWETLDNGQIISQLVPNVTVKKAEQARMYRRYNKDQGFDPDKDLIQVDLVAHPGSNAALQKELAEMRAAKEQLERELITTKQMHGKVLAEDARKDFEVKQEAERLKPKRRKSAK
ncbi:MAG: hypothetical protein ACE5H1_01185 [Thermodesulfobacteriota bacterium]